MPDLTPAHQVVLQTGMMGSMGGFAFRLPMIWGNLKNTSFIIFPSFGTCQKFVQDESQSYLKRYPPVGLIVGVLQIQNYGLMDSRENKHDQIELSLLNMNCKL